MKIKVSNLGPIRGPAEFDLKPLTILIGPNNAGKTWLAYTLAGLFSTYGELSYTAGEKSEQVVKAYPPLIQAVDKILTTGTATIDLCQFANEYSQKHFNSIASHASEWLPEFLGTQRASFHGLEISTKLEEAKKQIIDRILGYSLDFGIGVSKSNMLINVSKKKGQKDAYIYTTSKNPLEEELPRDVIERILTREVLQAIHHSLYPDVVTLPTEIDVWTKSNQRVAKMAESSVMR